MQFEMGSVGVTSRRTSQIRPHPRGKFPPALIKRIYFQRMRKRPHQLIHIEPFQPAQLFSYKPSNNFPAHITRLDISFFDQMREVPAPVPRELATCRQMPILNEQAQCDQIAVAHGQIATCEQYAILLDQAKCMELEVANHVAQIEPWHPIDQTAFVNAQLIPPIPSIIKKIELPDYVAKCSRFKMAETKETRLYVIPTFVISPQESISRFVFGIAKINYYRLKAELPNFAPEQYISPAPEVMSMASRHVICENADTPNPDFVLPRQPEISTFRAVRLGTSKCTLHQPGRLPEMAQLENKAGFVLPQPKLLKVWFKGKAAHGRRHKFIKMFQDPKIICKKKKNAWNFYLDVREVKKISEIYLNNMKVPHNNLIPIELSQNHISMTLENGEKFSSKVAGERSFYWFKLEPNLKEGRWVERARQGEYMLIVPADWQRVNPEAKCFLNLPKQELELDRWQGFRIHINVKSTEFPKFRLFNGMTRMCRWQNNDFPDK